MRFSQHQDAKPLHSQIIYLPLFFFFFFCIIPCGFNSFFEEMEVTVACHGTYHVAVKPPELFHRDKGANLSDTLLTVLVSGGKAGDASVVPENVVVLQWMLCWSCNNSFLLAAALTLVSLFFPSHYLFACCFLHYDHGQNVTLSFNLLNLFILS